MRDHTGRLGLIVSRLKQTPLEEHIPSRESKGVDLLRIEHSDVERKLKVRMGGKILGQTLHIINHGLVFDFLGHKYRHIHVHSGILTYLALILLSVLVVW